MLTGPPLNRTPMAPLAWPPPQGLPAHAAVSPWQRAGALRRLALAALSVLQAGVGTWFMSSVLPYKGAEPLEAAVLAVFAVLFWWVSAGFWTALMGFWVLLRGDRFCITANLSSQQPIAPDARTALVMPICNEDVRRVFAGLRATWQSLARSGAAAHFDLFVLSDSSDADARVAERHAWAQMCRDLGCGERVFYRWRRHRIKRKSGNVADFCRRWGRNYRYMVVLDADSVMSGACLSQLVGLMEAHPGAGIIQTVPRAAGRDTLYARAQQFAARVYGPLFTAGLHFWQLGESHYWGHNAIIRLAPFIRHCALARLPGSGALSGEILSHDFVEAALMRRAGWAVWIAYDLAGSYEEMPPNLVDELKRDRRWCHGNLINARLAFAAGLHHAHRAVFMTGVMSYVSAPLWFAFLLLSTALLASHTLGVPQYFIEPFQLFPRWPEWHEDWAITLGAVTAALLFLPKLLALFLILRKSSPYGGGARLFLSMLGEMLFSALLAPIRMLFHTQFVVSVLLGRPQRWQSPPRDDAETGWREAWRRHGGHTLFGIAWAACVYWMQPAFLWWLAPVAGALAASIPISVLSSRVAPGRAMRAAGFFVIPEESWTPRELLAARHHLRHAPPAPGFREAVLEPALNRLICATTPRRAASSPALADSALAQGLDTLSAQQKSALLCDSAALSRLHQALLAV
jgi:membrane glycosyltransferase